MAVSTTDIGVGEYKYGFSDDVKPEIKFDKGLSRQTVEDISAIKNEPGWMTENRLKAYEIFLEKPMPEWGADLSDIDFDDIIYFVRASDRKMTDWDDVPEEIKNTFEKLGIPESERKFLAGAEAQYDSESVYGALQGEWEKQGVIFVDTDTALREHEKLLKKYFGTVVPASDNKLAALNTAVWSGGSFLYIPKGVRVGLPLQAYFRINTQNMGQFERTMIIADEGSNVQYIEGCTAPTYTTNSLHSAVVEIICKKDSRVRYTTLQNWSGNVYNLVTKRAVAQENATMEWIDANLGSKVTMKYPSVYLTGKGAKADIISIAFAGDNQHQDVGSKVVHLAPYTTSKIVSKSISKGIGRSTYRGLVKIHEGMKGCKSNVNCDALLLDEASGTDTYPYIEIEDPSAAIEHEATVSKLSDEQLFYLMQRGIPEDEARNMIINGFIEPFTKTLPLEYAVEMNRLIELQMDGSVG
ncbi:MAG: Fe-S cluster assembly protein SufB [Candidatus Marinimicrobia bacterium]|nr:Fe-S cluster assembly protein SufB [Candidatus Neomarinimicrobiota bacterium]